MLYFGLFGQFEVLGTTETFIQNELKFPESEFIFQGNATGEM